MALNKFLPSQSLREPGKAKLIWSLTDTLDKVASLRKTDAMLPDLIDRLEKQQRWIDLAEYWTAEPEVIYISARIKAYGLKAEAERHRKCLRAIERYHRFACYFVGAFKERHYVATAVFTWEMDRALLELDRHLFGAHDIFVAERKMGPESDAHVKRGEKKRARDDSIEKSAREFLGQETVQSVRLLADIARHVHQKCPDAKGLKLPTIIGILRSRGIRRR